MEVLYYGVAIFVLYLIVPLIVCSFFKEKLRKKTVERISFYNGLVLTIAFCGYGTVESFINILRSGFNVIYILHFIGALLGVWCLYHLSKFGEKMMLSLCLEENEEGENDGINKEN